MHYRGESSLYINAFLFLRFKPTTTCVRLNSEQNLRDLRAVFSIARVGARLEHGLVGGCSSAENNKSLMRAQQ